MSQQGVYQGSLEVAGRRMHNHARGFFYNQKVVIFEKNRKRNFFRSDLAAAWGFFKLRQSKNIASLDWCRGFKLPGPFTDHSAAFSQGSRPGSGNPESFGQKHVQPLALIL